MACVWHLVCIQSSTVDAIVTSPSLWLPWRCHGDTLHTCTIDVDFPLILLRINTSLWHSVHAPYVSLSLVKYLLHCICKICMLSTPHYCGLPRDKRTTGNIPLLQVPLGTPHTCLAGVNTSQTSSDCATNYLTAQIFWKKALQHGRTDWLPIAMHAHT